VTICEILAYWIRCWFHIATHLVQMFLLCFCFLSGRSLTKNVMVPSFKSDRDEYLQHCSSGIYASIDGVGFRIWRHTFRDGCHNAISRSLARSVWRQWVQYSFLLNTQFQLLNFRQNCPLDSVDAKWTGLYFGENSRIIRSAKRSTCIKIDSSFPLTYK